LKLLDRTPPVGKNRAWPCSSAVEDDPAFIEGIQGARGTPVWVPSRSGVPFRDV